MYYYLPEPPIVLILIGLFVGITSGLAFQETLKEKVQKIMKDRREDITSNLQTLELVLPFLSTCVGICIFLAGGLEIFIVNRWISYGFALPLTILTGALVWNQLDKLLKQLQEGGSAAIDLDGI